LHKRKLAVVVAGREEGGGKGLPSYGLATVATGSMWHFIKGRRRHDLNGEFGVLAPFGLAGWLAGWHSSVSRWENKRSRLSLSAACHI